MPVPHRTLKGPPTLYGKSALLELYASPSYVVSLEPYSLGLHIILLVLKVMVLMT